MPAVFIRLDNDLEGVGLHDFDHYFTATAARSSISPPATLAITESPVTRGAEPIPRAPYCDSSHELGRVARAFKPAVPRVAVFASVPDISAFRESLARDAASSVYAALSRLTTRRWPRAPSTC